MFYLCLRKCRHFYFKGVLLTIVLAQDKKIFYSYFVPAMACASLILVLCLMSPKYIPDIEFRLLSPDKIAHFLLFGLLLQSLIWGLVKNQLFSYRNIFWFTAATIAYGALIELLQMLMRNGRSADVDDIVADAIGAVLVCLIHLVFYRSLSRRISRSAENP